MMQKVDISLGVASIDLDPIKFKLMNSTEGINWSREKADRVEIEYRQFLELCLVYCDQVIVPSKCVDIFWHNHILDTKKYADDCDAVFGYFLHHFPYLGTRGAADKAALTQQFEKSKLLLQTRFGIQTSSNQRMGDGSVCGGSCGGGDCSGGDLSARHQGIDLATRPSL